MAKKGDTGTGTPRFEEALGQLEAVVRQLEDGALPLEDALGAFERGVGLVKHLSERLTEVEARVEALVRSHAGTLAVTPVEDDDDDAPSS